MRSLRSRNVQQSDSDNYENKSKIVDYESEPIKPKRKHKKLKEEAVMNGFQIKSGELIASTKSDNDLEKCVTLPEENILKKKKRKKLKKSATTNEFEAKLSETNSEVTNENDPRFAVAEEQNLKKKKHKKLKKRATINEFEVELGELNTSTKSEMTSENYSEECVSVPEEQNLRKKIHKKLKKRATINELEVKSGELNTSTKSEMTSENDCNEERVVKKKKSKKVRNNDVGITSGIDNKQTNLGCSTETNESTEKPKKKKSRKQRKIRSESNLEEPEQQKSDRRKTLTYLNETKPSKNDGYSPKFSTAINSTVLKPRKSEICPTEADESDRRKTSTYSNEDDNSSITFTKPSKNEKYSPILSTVINSTVLKSRKSEISPTEADKSPEYEKIDHNSPITFTKPLKNEKYSPKFSTAITSTVLKSRKSEISPTEANKSPEYEKIDHNSSITFTKPLKNEKYSPKFSTAITSTVLKPSKLEISLIEADEALKSNKEHKKSLKNKTDDSLSITFNVSLIKSNKSRYSPKFSTAVTSTALKPKRPEKSLEKSNIEELEENTIQNNLADLSNRRNTFDKTENAINKRETFSKTENIAINGSPEIINLKPEITSDEDSETETNKLEEESIITISDTPEKSPKQNTFNKSRTELNDTGKSDRISDISESILEPIIDIYDSLEETKLKQKTNEVKNSSGDWTVEQNQPPKDVLNETFEIVNKENVISPKSLRKKWHKFPRYSSGAQSILDSISSPKLQKKLNAAKIVEKITKTPKELYKLQKPSTVSKLSVKKSPISTKKSTTTSSSKKSVTKRTIMPNFARIHQKAFEKMENLKEYSDRKQQRAEMLLNPGSKQKTSIKPDETKAKSSRQLFTEKNEAKNGIKINRFGFKAVEFKPLQNPVVQREVAKPIVKPSIYARPDVIAIANKNKTVKNNRENKRDILKGVRTNRRFELLMQMRNK